MIPKDKNKIQTTPTNCNKTFPSHQLTSIDQRQIPNRNPEPPPPANSLIQMLKQPVSKYSFPMSHQSTTIMRSSRLKECHSNHQLHSTQSQESISSIEDNSSITPTKSPSSLFASASSSNKPFAEDSFPVARQVKKTIGRRLVMDLTPLLEEEEEC